MQKQEFEERIERTVTDWRYRTAGDGHTGTASSKCLVQRLITTGRQTSCNRLMTWFLNRTRSSWQETSM